MRVARLHAPRALALIIASMLGLGASACVPEGRAH